MLKLDFWGENKPKIDPLPSRNLSKLKKLKELMIYRKERQTIETLINEEAYLLAKYLRGERKAWKPRLPDLV